MTKDGHDPIEQAAKLDRRDVSAGGAAASATVALHVVAPAVNITSAGEFQVYGAVCVKLNCLNRFNDHTYAVANFQNVREVSQGSKSQGRRV